MQTHTRRGSTVEFKLTTDDSGLRRALAFMGREGGKRLDGLMKQIIDEEVERAKLRLKMMARALAGVKVPQTTLYVPMRRFKQSKNIHVKVADALKNERVRSKHYTVHTGNSLNEAAVGVLGQRGGRLAHIVAKGIDPFRYGNLPTTVRSSTAFYAATGQPGGVSFWMRMRGSHPGFYQTFDYIGTVEQMSKKQFQEVAPVMIKQMARQAGFAEVPTKSKLSSKVKGQGVMFARGGE